MDGLVEISEGSVDYGIFCTYSEGSLCTITQIAFGNVVVEISRGGGLCRSVSGQLPGRLAST